MIGDFPPSDDDAAQVLQTDPLILISELGGDISFRSATYPFELFGSLRLAMRITINTVGGIAPP